MKKVLLSGALAFAMLGTTAFAGEGMNEECATGGAMEGSVNCPSDMSTSDQSLDNDAYGGSGMDQGSMGPDHSATQPQAQPQTETNVIVQPPAEPQPAWTAAQPSEEDKKITKGSDLRGVSVTLGGGVEGYTGDLAPQIDAGPAWGIGLGLRPTKNLGVELGYSGAVNNLTPGGRNDGRSDLIRNGGSAVATVGLSSAAVQPYLLGGIGIDRYSVSNDNSVGFRDDTSGQVPLGVGVRGQVSKFTADLRGTYGVLFDQGFAPREGPTNLGEIGNRTPTGRFGAQLRLGSTF